ncbi:MAG: glycosyltransferase family 2 protein [Actinobacteria bacterium]|nr:glycosyltransferase family 2 protein [Actinomycetota bacterium]
MTPNDRGSVTVVVVAYGHPQELARCLQPVSGEYPVIVVDNAGEAACRRVVEASGATYVASGRNLGFAAGVNKALGQVPAGHHVLLLNPDAVIEAADVDHMAEVMGKPGNELLAAVAPRQHGKAGVEQRVLWPFPSPSGAWLEALGLGWLSRRSSFLVGSILLLRNDALTDVGLFDERFFLYAEEADWQRRAHRRGWTVQVCNDVRAYHAGAGTSTDPWLRERLFHSSVEELLRKWYGSAGWTSARVAAVVGALIRAAVRRGDDRRQAWDRACLYLRGPRRAARGLETS